MVPDNKHKKKKFIFYFFRLITRHIKSSTIPIHPVWGSYLPSCFLLHFPSAIIILFFFFFYRRFIVSSDYCLCLCLCFQTVVLTLSKKLTTIIIFQSKFLINFFLSSRNKKKNSSFQRMNSFLQCIPWIQSTLKRKYNIKRRKKNENDVTLAVVVIVVIVVVWRFW